MSRGLGTLTLDLVARVGGFEQPLNRAARTSRSAMGDIEGSTNKASASFQRMIRLAGVLGGTAALGRAISTTATFSQEIANLSAITGAVGEGLAIYRKEAIEIGRTTSLSATQTAEAFKLIGSQQPELLKSAAALTAVTREAVTLAEATGQTLPQSARALSSVINQFGLDADRANEVINVLASSAQLGTVEVDNVSESLRNSGAAAKQLGVDYVETIAAIQALAKGQIEGAQAGTGLRQVLLSLEQTNDRNLMPSVVGLTQAIANLSDRQLDAIELTKIFGREGFIAGATLIEQRAILENLNMTMRGTNTATEQAATRTQTLANQFQQLGSALEGLTLTLFSGEVEDANKSIVTLATDGINLLTDNIELLEFAITTAAAVLGTRLVAGLVLFSAQKAKNIAQIIALDFALVKNTVTTRAAAVGYTALSAAARGASVAMALVGGPVGAALIAAYALTSFTNRAVEAREELRSGSLNDEVEKLQENFKKMSDGAKSATFAELTSEQMRLNRELQEANERYRDLEESARNATRAGSPFADVSQQARISQQAGVIRDIEAALNGVAEKQQALFNMGASDNWKELTESIEGTAGAGEEVNENLEKIIRGLQDQVFELLTSADAFEEMNAIRSAGVDIMSEEADSIRDLIKWRNELRELEEQEKKQTQTNEEAEQIRQSLLSQEESILESYKRRRQIILDNTLHTGEAQKDLLLKLEEQTAEELLSVSDNFWERYLVTAKDQLESMDEMIASTINNLSAGFGSAFESMIFDSQSLGEAFSKLSIDIARSMIRSLGEMAGQWLAYQAVQMAVGKTAAATAAGSAISTANAQVAMAGLNAFSSTAAIPIVGPAMAPAASAAAIAATTPMAATVSSFMLTGMAHDGMDSIPNTGTWLLEKGERVTTASTSAKLDSTLARIESGMSTGMSGGMTIKQEINIGSEGVSEQTMTLVRQAARQGAEEGYKMVVNDFKNNGPVRKLARSA